MTLITTHDANAKYMYLLYGSSWRRKLKVASSTEGSARTWNPNHNPYMLQPLITNPVATPNHNHLYYI
jgi:hypothetical protein